MSMPGMYKFFDHTADVLFVAKGDTLAEVFTQCGLATEETMVDLEGVEPVEQTKILCEEMKLDRLLFDFLDELIFFKDYKQLIFCKFDISIEQRGNKHYLSCIAWGEKLNLARHDPKVDVKAVTMHEFKLEYSEEKKQWKAQVILDI